MEENQIHIYIYIYMCVCLCVHTIQNGCRYLSNLASLEKQMLGDFEHLFKDYGHVSLLLTLTCVHGEVVNWCILSKQQWYAPTAKCSAMIPSYRAWHKRCQPWPTEPLESYLALLYQMELGKRYQKDILHGAARFLGLTTAMSQEYMESWEQMGLILLHSDGTVELNSDHGVYGISTPPRKPIPASCRHTCSELVCIITAMNTLNSSW